MIRIVIGACLLALICVPVGCSKTADEKSGKSGNGNDSVKALKLPVSQTLIGTWKIEAEVDEDKLKGQLWGDVPDSELDDPVNASAMDDMVNNVKTIASSTKLVINSDGTYKELKKMGALHGGLIDITLSGTWEVTNAAGNSATMKFTGKDFFRKDETYEIKITFLDDTSFRVDESPRLKGFPLKRKAIFRKRQGPAQE